MLGHAGRAIRNAAWAVGAILLFVLVTHFLRDFVALYRVHPWLGWAYAGLAATLGFFLVAALLPHWFSYPRALTPPPRPEPSQASFGELRAYAKYLARYLTRLARNSNLTDAERREAQEAADEIWDTLRAHPLKDDLVRAIEEAEARRLAPLLARLHDLAAAEVRHSVRDVMLAVALSPFHGLDLLIVLYRNAAMVLRIVHIFAARPSPRDEWRTLRDTLSVVLAVNLIHFSRTLLEGLFARLPLIGRVAEDLAQGLGAGALTSAAGHAAIQRCAAYAGWNREEAVASLAAHAQRFFRDVKDIFSADLLPALQNRIRSAIPPGTSDQPGFWENLVSGVGQALDAAASALGQFLVRPALVTTAGVVQAGYWATRRAARAGGRLTRRAAGAGARAVRDVFRVFRLVGQRLKYARGPRPQP